MFYDVICYVQSTSALSPFFFGVCLPIDQVAEKSKRKTDAVEDPQIRGGKRVAKWEKSWFNNG